MRMEKPADVRNFIKEFIVKIGSGELDGVKNPGVIVQALNCWLKCWELEQNTQIEKRISAIEKRIEEAGIYEKLRESEFD